MIQNRTRALLSRNLLSQQQRPTIAKQHRVLSHLLSQNNKNNKNNTPCRCYSIHHHNNGHSQQQSNEKTFTVKPHINFQHLVHNTQMHQDNIVNRSIAGVDAFEIKNQFHKYTAILLETNQIRNYRRIIADYMAGKISPNDLPEGLLELALGKQGEALSEEWELFKSKRTVTNAQKNPNGVMCKEEKDIWQKTGKELKETCAKKEIELDVEHSALMALAVKLPNLTHKDTPIGDEAVLIDEVGSKEQVIAGKNKIYDNYDILLRLDIADFDRASLISGSKFYFLKNEGVLLEFALIQFALSKLIKYGFTLTTTPELVRRDVVEACGFQPRGENSQIYNIQDSDLVLAGTSEISLAGYLADKIIENWEPMPQKLSAVSHCFRTEAGAGGKRDKGLYRVHQFTKVEMFAVTTEEQSEEMLNHLVSIQKEIFSDLGLHFKVLNMPSTDLGAPAYNKIDIEAYMPGRDAYGEVSSASNCTDYQARRLGIKLRTVDPQLKQQINVYAHTLNATCIAIPRAIVALVETYQFETEDGRIGVTIPEALRPFMHGMEQIVEKKK